MFLQTLEATMELNSVKIFLECLAKKNSRIKNMKISGESNGRILAKKPRSFAASLQFLSSASNFVK